MKNFKKKVAKIYNQIGAIDKILIFLMVILVSHVLLSLFLDTRFGPIDDDIDIIVRTSMASIFGYFLSINFMRNNDTKVDRSVTDHYVNNDHVVMQNEVSPPTNITAIELDSLPVEPYPYPPAIETETVVQSNDPLEQDIPQSIQNSNEAQAIILGIFCVTVLSCLIFYRLINKDINPPTVTISQLRDIIAGCIGYLIGCPSIVNDK